MDSLPVQIAQKSIPTAITLPAKGSLQFVEQVTVTNAGQMTFPVSQYFSTYDAIEMRFIVDTLGNGAYTYAVFGLGMLNSLGGQEQVWYTTSGNQQTAMGITASGQYQKVTGVIHLTRISHWNTGTPGLMVMASTATDGSSSSARLTRQSAGSASSILVLSLYNGSYNFSATASVFGLVK